MTINDSMFDMFINTLKLPYKVTWLAVRVMAMLFKKFQSYRGGFIIFNWWRKPKKAADLPEVTDKLDHIIDIIKH